MYQIDEYVMKVNTGLCHIENIVHLDGIGIEKNKLYYLLIPLSDDKSKIYVPVDPEPTSIRHVMNIKEAWSLIERISSINEVTIKNEKQREQEYKNAIKSTDPERWASIIKTMYLRKQKRTAEGKKSTAMDEHYFKVAEDYLYSELAFAIGKEKSEILHIIAETIQNK